MMNNVEKHLNHPFYKDADTFREGIRLGQIIYGAGKYPEPFNPDSWTAEELLKHAAQEDVDKWHYTYGLYEKIKKMEEALKYYANENNYIDSSMFTEIGADRGFKARKALGMED